MKKCIYGAICTLLIVCNLEFLYAYQDEDDRLNCSIVSDGSLTGTYTNYKFENNNPTDIFPGIAPGYIRKDKYRISQFPEDSLHIYMGVGKPPYKDDFIRLELRQDSTFFLSCIIESDGSDKRFCSVGKWNVTQDSLYLKALLPAIEDSRHSAEYVGKHYISTLPQRFLIVNVTPNHGGEFEYVLNKRNVSDDIQPIRREWDWSARQDELLEIKKAIADCDSTKFLEWYKKDIKNQTECLHQLYVKTAIVNRRPEMLLNLRKNILTSYPEDEVGDYYQFAIRGYYHPSKFDSQPEDTIGLKVREEKVIEIVRNWYPQPLSDKKANEIRSSLDIVPIPFPLMYQFMIY